jgi:flagellar hook-length control protein FliK
MQGATPPPIDEAPIECEQEDPPSGWSFPQTATVPSTSSVIPGAAVTSGGAVPSETASRRTAAKLDLPVFLQVLPKADRSVALAAAREPAMAEALRRLPKIQDMSAMTASARGALGSVSTLAMESPALRLPQFLMRTGTPTTVSAAAVKLPDPSSLSTAAHLVDGTMSDGVRSFAASGNASVQPASDAPVPAGTLSAPLGTDPWQQDLSAQLALMAGQGEEGHAVMKLSPAELGDLEIRLTVRDREASVAFSAAAPEARAALELAQPRLQEMFAAQGLNLSETLIFNDLDRNPDVDSWRRPAAISGVTPSAESDEDAEPVRRRIALGMVDTYA